MPPKKRPPRADGRPPYAPHDRAKHPGVSTIPAPNSTDGRGRPAIVVDELSLYELALTHAGFEHMGRILGVSGMMLSTHPIYREIIDRARAEQKQRLLAAQFASAITDRNPTMQIWLGKQYLGQKDVQRVESSGPNGKPIQTEVAYKAVAYFPENGRNKQLPTGTAKLLNKDGTSTPIDAEEVVGDDPDDPDEQYGDREALDDYDEEYGDTLGETK